MAVFVGALADGADGVGRAGVQVDAHHHLPERIGHQDAAILELAHRGHDRERLRVDGLRFTELYIAGLPVTPGHPTIAPAQREHDHGHAYHGTNTVFHGNPSR
ncbi:MAG: hypothetical protein F4022_09860 [Gemmatimonadetes bacterium]|nr:hypothetical protein [Gemmatimonadota bacterium]